MMFHLIHINLLIILVKSTALKPLGEW